MKCRVEERLPKIAPKVAVLELSQAEVTAFNKWYERSKGRESLPTVVKTIYIALPLDNMEENVKPDQEVTL